MIALVLALVLAQSPVLTAGQVRSCNAIAGAMAALSPGMPSVSCGPSLPFFYFDQTDLAAYGNCPPGNLIAASETFNDTTRWTIAASGSSVPVITPNAGLAPDGVSMTADRVQISACATANSFGGVDQLLINSNGGVSTNYQTLRAPLTFKIQVKGYAGTSGSLSLWFYASNVVLAKAAVCTYNGTTYTPCEVTLPNDVTYATWSVSNVAFGCNNSNNATPRSNTGAADVLVFGGQLTPALSSGPYYATGYLAGGKFITTRTGHSIVGLRSGGYSYCDKSQGAAAVPGDLVWTAAGQPRVSVSATGEIGIMADGYNQNLLGSSETFSLPSNVCAGGGCVSPGAGTYTPNYALAPDNSFTASLVGFRACPIGGATIGSFSTLEYNVNPGSGTFVFSIYAAGTGTTSMYVTNGSTLVTLGSCTGGGAVFNRCQLPFFHNGVGVLQYGIGCTNNSYLSWTGGNTGNANFVLWGRAVHFISTLNVVAQAPKAPTYGLGPVGLMADVAAVDFGGPDGGVGDAGVLLLSGLTTRVTYSRTSANQVWPQPTWFYLNSSGPTVPVASCGGVTSCLVVGTSGAAYGLDAGIFALADAGIQRSGTVDAASFSGAISVYGSVSSAGVSGKWDGVSLVPSSPLNGGLDKPLRYLIIGSGSQTTTSGTPQTAPSGRIIGGCVDPLRCTP
jgi:hypothetical protein